MKKTIVIFLMFVDLNSFADPSIDLANIAKCTKNLVEFGFEPALCNTTCSTVPEKTTHKDCKACVKDLQNMCNSACNCIWWGNVAVGLQPFTIDYKKHL